MSLDKKDWLRYQLVAKLAILIIIANIVSSHESHLFYFNFSTGTLFFHLIVASLITLFEFCGERKTIGIIWLTGILNCCINLCLYFVFMVPVPKYWSVTEIPMQEDWRQLNVMLLLGMDYICTGLGIAWSGCLFKKWFEHHLLLRVSMMSLVALLLDLLLLVPIMIFLTQDHYEIAWRMLSLASVKAISTLMAIPLTFLLIVWRKRALQ